MLERFAAQSLVEYDGELIFSKEKFAELIVAECCQQINSQCFPSNSREWCEKGAWNGYLVAQIREHFGVES
jgi:hypothetical protein